MTKQSRSWHFVPSPIALVALAAAALLVAPATGQCPLQWLPGPQLSGTDEMIVAVCEWDPDGAGPRTPVIVAGGKFVVAGSVIANRIAAYDPATSSWSGFGTGMNGDVFALAVLPSGDFVAAGSFTAAGGNPANQIARWDGSSWSPLGTGTTGPVRALAVLPNGDLVAGGTFTVAGGAFVSNIARWNGLAWASFGIGVNNGVNNTVHALATMPNGDLVAGGDFTIAGGAAASRVARWNGASWSSLGAGTTTGVRSLVARPNGFLVAGTQNIPSLVPSPPIPVVLEWDGSAWTVLLTVHFLSSAAIGDIAILPSGDVAVAGVGVQSWNGATWSVLAATPNVIALTVLANGALVAGGRFFSIGGVNVENVALWNGTAWSATGPAPGPTGVSLPMLAAAGGDLISVVNFGDNSTSVGRWIGNTWSPFGGAFPYATVTDIALHPSGDVIAVGTFASAGGTPANRVARWNGTAWSPLGAGIDGLVWAVATLPNGDIVVAGDYLVAGGVPANGVARWNGTAWSQLGTGLNGVLTLLALPNGDLLAGCRLPAAAGVMRWDGSSWSPLGTLPINVYALASLPNGDVVAGGTFTQAGTVTLDHIARWNG
ncbi:MAG TPA: WD40 repeat domain-containing protein, partial [Planctomycetota bacterium]|nr:WD40 repeat domain-containing protein [Planctomycetota bacterium]